MLALDLDLNTQVQCFVFFFNLSCDWLLCTETWWFAHSFNDYCGQIQVYLGEQPDYLLETKWRGIGFGENERESSCITVSKETVGRKEGTMCWKHVQYVQFRRFNLLLQGANSLKSRKSFANLSAGLGKSHIGLWSNGLIEAKNEQRGEWQCQNAITQRRKPRYISSY